MSEKITTIYERADDENAREFFARYGHVALANVYDSSLGQPAANVVISRVRLRANNRLSGQVGNVNHSDLSANNPLGHVIMSTLQSAETLGEPFESMNVDELRAQIIDQRRGAEGVWHRDNGIIVSTLEGSSRFEIDGGDDSVDAAYELEPGRIVVMNPRRRLWHRGVATSRSSRTGLAIAKTR